MRFCPLRFAGGDGFLGSGVEDGAGFLRLEPSGSSSNPSCLSVCLP